MCAFVVLGLVFSTPSQEIGLGKRLRNELFCVELDVKPELNQSIYSLPYVRPNADASQLSLPHGTKQQATAK